MSRQELPGWYGKLPALGDFISRRLSPDFIEVWDNWLSTGMSQLRHTLGEEWLNAYLKSPIWRFLLMPGALPGKSGEMAWVGILMPSVDRVGRYFPFTITQAFYSHELSTIDLDSVWSWLDRMEEVAAEALHNDWNLGQLDREINEAPNLLPRGDRTFDQVSPASLGSQVDCYKIEFPSINPLQLIFKNQWSEFFDRNSFWFAIDPNEYTKTFRVKSRLDASNLLLLFSKEF